MRRKVEGNQPDAFRKRDRQPGRRVVISQKHIRERRPALLVVFGDNLERYPNAQSLQKYVGVAPVREKSGRQSWTHWRWATPKFLRQRFVEWAGQTVVYCDWAHAYYAQQRRAGKAHHATLRALAFKWIRILWRCWRDQKPYDEHRYLAALRQQGSPLAAAFQIT